VRDWHEIVRYELTDDGKCRHCGTAPAGRFGHYDRPFGRRRVPVRIALAAGL